MLEAEKFPASVAYLNACLADVDANRLTHGCENCLDRRVAWRRSCRKTAAECGGLTFRHLSQNGYGTAAECA
eukprot:9474955-Pyramimonas_sp.AAC.1